MSSTEAALRSAPLDDLGQAATPQLFEDLTACPEAVQEIAEWMTDAAPRIPTEVVVGQAAVLQLFEMVNKRGDLVAGCRVTEGALQVGAPGVAAALCCLQSLRNGVCAGFCCRRRMSALRLPLRQPGDRLPYSEGAIQATAPSPVLCTPAQSLAGHCRCIRMHT